MRIAALMICLLIAGCGSGNFPESCFDLSSESRLPAWFSLPKGTSRQAVTVRMCYYVDGSGRSATFALRETRVAHFNLGAGQMVGKTLAEAKGKDGGLHPLTATNSEPRPFEYPKYKVITVGDITEVIEHRRMDAIFYVVDDPDIRQSLGVDT